MSGSVDNHPREPACPPPRSGRDVCSLRSLQRSPSQREGMSKGCRTSNPEHRPWNAERRSTSAGTRGDLGSAAKRRRRRKTDGLSVCCPHKDACPARGLLGRAGSALFRGWSALRFLCGPWRLLLRIEDWGFCIGDLGPKSKILNSKSPISTRSQGCVRCAAGQSRGRGTRSGTGGVIGGRRRFRTSGRLPPARRCCAPGLPTPRLRHGGRVALRMRTARRRTEHAGPGQHQDAAGGRGSICRADLRGFPRASSPGILQSRSGSEALRRRDSASFGPGEFGGAWGARLQGCGSLSQARL